MWGSTKIHPRDQQQVLPPRSNTNYPTQEHSGLHLHGRSYYRGRRGSRLICFCPDHGYIPQKNWWSGSFWSFLVTSPRLMLRSGYGDARASEISIHMYADDTQLYVSFSPEDFPAAQAKMERCIAQIRQWLSQNCLKSNDGKTELMVIGQPAQLKKITSDINITIGDSVISGSHMYVILAQY